MNSNVKIDSINVEHVIDTDPDTSWIGEYTSDLEDGVIVRQYDKFYEDLTEEEIEKIDIRNSKYTREYMCFRPYAGGEEIGTKEYKVYGIQDYERMEKINNGSIWFIGIIAKAIVRINGVHNIITSGGVWGIESDIDGTSTKEIEEEQLTDLKEQLEELNIDTTNFDDIKIERKG